MHRLSKLVWDPLWYYMLAQHLSAHSEHPESHTPGSLALFVLPEIA